MATSVRYIPASLQMHSSKSVQLNGKRRTAAYARVSTASEEQQTSYDAQVDYYTKYIDERPDWEFAGMYADEGISGLSLKKRDGFNSMVSDALAGRIDLIITKSVSRFARNTVDCLSIVRKLREKQVEVFFEKENIYTFDGKGELLLSILASLSQEEAKNISDNTKWGLRKRFADGKVVMPYAQFLGFEKGEDGLPRIVESEAKTVRMIYRLFMEGKTPSAIARYLINHGIATPGGKKVWQPTTVESILSNEKYRGDAILQKTFTADFLTKKMKVNNGELPQYYVENSHPAIIDPQEFEAVQIEMERRKKLGRPSACNSPLSTKLVCGDCGGFYGAKVWGSNTKYRKVIWQCNNKYKNEEKCSTPHVVEEEVKQKFLEVFNNLLEYRTELVSACRQAQEVLCDCSGIQPEIDKLKLELEVTTELTRKSIQESSMKDLASEEMQKQTAAYLEKQKQLKTRINELDEHKQERNRKATSIGHYIRNLEEQKTTLTAFDERVWAAVVQTVTIQQDGGLVFSFKDGTERKV